MSPEFDNFSQYRIFPEFLTGGNPAIENKQIPKLKLNKGLEKNKPFNSEIYLISSRLPVLYGPEVI